MPPVLALDVGGTKIAAVLVGEDGRLVAEPARLPTPAGDAEAVYAVVLEVLTQALGTLAWSDLAGIGVGCGGPLRWPLGPVSPLHIPAWRDFPLVDRLRELRPGGPVRLHNDAVTFLAGEHWRGAAAGSADVLGMVVSTGVGAALILDGRLRDGPGGSAGHLGHVVVDPWGPPCACGGRGCLEAIARGPAVVAWALAQGWRPPAGPGPDGVSLTAAAEAGEPVAIAALARAGAAIGVALASASALLDLRRVVVGGGLSGAGDLLFGPMRAAFAVHARLPASRATVITPAALGHPGLLGAAALVLAGPAYWSPTG